MVSTDTQIPLILDTNYLIMEIQLQILEDYLVQLINRVDTVIQYLAVQATILDYKDQFMELCKEIKELTHINTQEQIIMWIIV